MEWAVLWVPAAKISSHMQVYEDHGRKWYSRPLSTVQHHHHHHQHNNDNDNDNNNNNIKLEDYKLRVSLLDT